MMRRTPMKRTGWPRQMLETSLPAPTRPLGYPPPEWEESTKLAIKTIRKARAVMVRVGELPSVLIAKENAVTSPAYQSAVRRLPCIRCGIQGFTQFCHSDEGKGMAIKTDDRRGWPGCGPHGTEPGCHWYVGTSGNLKQSERRALEAEYSARTRAMVEAKGEWPARLPKWEPDS